MTAIRPPLTLETATAKVRAAEDAWNSRDPLRVSLAYSEDAEWRNRDRFFRGRDQIRQFLNRDVPFISGPFASKLRMNSTVNRVPRITGFPIMTRGSTTMRFRRLPLFMI
jgi:Protein of unknown function (DUF1348)